MHAQPLFTSRARDALVRLAVLYLACPVLLFLLTWLKPAVASVAAGLLLIAIWPVIAVGPLDLRMPNRRQLAVTGCALAVAAFMAVFCFPTPETVPMNDIVKHATLRSDLLGRWPVQYFSDEQGADFLRYSLAYYLAPAAIAKALGADLLGSLTVAWTALGVSLYLLIVAGESESVGGAVFSIATGALFSGLSILYVLWSTADAEATWSSLTSSWARGLGNHWLQGSHPFELRWSPQHAIASWLLAAIAVRAPTARWLLASGFALIAFALMWSPFVAVSFAILLACAWLQGTMGEGRRDALAVAADGLRVLRGRANLAGLLLTFIVLAYLLKDSAAIPARLFVLEEPPRYFFAHYVLYTGLEFLLLAAAVWLTAGRLDVLTLGGIVLLLALPFTHIGAEGDLQMRGSQLPAAVLLFAALGAIRRAQRPAGRIVVVAMLSIGIVAGVQELLMAGMQWPDLSVPRIEPMPLAKFGNQAAITPQYVARAKLRSGIGRALDFSSSRPLLERRTVLRTEDFHWSAFGQAADVPTRTVRSQESVDAALFSQSLDLPAGWYRMTVLASWDVGSDSDEHAAHFSLHGRKIIIPVFGSKANQRRLTAAFQSDGRPVELSFGLGGWAEGRGSITLHSIEIESVHVIEDGSTAPEPPLPPVPDA